MGEVDIKNALLGYLSRDIAKSKVLDNNLFVIARAKKGDRDAIKELIESNIRLVVKFASNFKVQGDVFMDLISEGCLGIMRAIKKYDPSKGVKFSSYASIWIRHCMLRYLSESKNLIKIPFRKKKMVKEILLDAGKNFSSYDDSEINNINQLINVVFISDFLNSSYSEEFCSGVNDIENFIEKQYISLVIQEKISRLSPKEQFIIKNRFGLDGKDEKSLLEIAKILGGTPEGVRYIEHRALKKLKRMLEEESVI
ncbi:MAG: sigma-70 family RNA polymerase sigma factor [Brevinematia bacterium]